MQGAPPTVRRAALTLALVLTAGLGAGATGAGDDTASAAPTTAEPPETTEPTDSTGSPETTAATGTAGATGTTDGTDGTHSTATTGTGETATTVTASSAAGGGTYHATIRRTTHGVAHILADDIPSAMFGQGYANAEDHACTLADQLLKVQGRRAAALGPGDANANVESDFAWLAIGIDALAREDWAGVDAEVTAIFDGFAAGWNAHLDEVGVDGLTGWCAGADWVTPITGEDVYAYARSITLLASSARLASFMSNAQPPAAGAAGLRAAPTTGGPAGEQLDVVAAELAALGLGPDAGPGSNAWAVGRDRVTGGSGGILVGNPHFPWEGELRFWEVQLTVPGELDIYGANLIGLPGVGVGFTDQFAWSHTVSAGRRFTAYRIDLVAGDPTSYLVDGQPVAMTSTAYDVDVLQPDGTTTTEQRTLWRTEYGPVIDFPGVGWTDTQAVTFRDANIDNDELIEQQIAMTMAASLDDLIAAHRDINGIPLFNTVAVSRDGRAWYADTSATPNLTDEAEQLMLEALLTDPLAKLAWDNGAALLNGSDSRFRWEEVPGARDPGLVPFDEQPAIERADYVFNANDSFWVVHGDEVLAGDYSALQGAQGTARSVRTRENDITLADGPDGAAGPDGTFTGVELRDAAVRNVGGAARLLREPVVARCQASPVVAVAELTADDGNVTLPAETVDLTAACGVLAAWDGVYDLDRAGPAIWREFLGQYATLDELWAEPFDPARPIETPSGLAAAPAGEPDPVLQHLARAVQVLTKNGFALDVTLGAIQYSDRGGERIAIHGGLGQEGVTNVVSGPSAGRNSSTEPLPPAPPAVSPFTTLSAEGYRIEYGSSFFFTVDYTAGDPTVWAWLTYGETGDRTSPLLDVQTQAFSAKEWREVAFTEDAIESDPELVTYDVSG